jgi:hypothetical protein
MTQSQPLRKGVWKHIRLALCRLLCDEPSPQPPPGQGRPRRSLFVPGQVMIVAQFPSKLELDKQTIAKRVRERYDALRLERKLRLDIGAVRVAILRGPEITLATVLGDVPQARQDPRLLIDFIRELHDAIALPPIPPRPRDDTPEGQTPNEQYPPDKPGTPSDNPGAGNQPPGSVVATGPSAAPAAAARKTKADDDGFDLRAASPNWLASGAKNFIGGGPGAVPVTITQATINAMAARPWEFEALPAGLQPGGAPGSVEVAILDTVPNPGLLLDAYNTWVGNDQANPAQPPLETANELLKDLLSDSNGEFNVLDVSEQPSTIGNPDSIDVVYAGGLFDDVVAEHPYAMASHGLFVAGIVRSLAPQAKLRLIQVLNDNGGGSMSSFTHGLEVAIQPDRTTPLVINCSFTFAIPRPGDPPPEPGEDTIPADQLPALTQAVQDLFAAANQWDHVVFVAAAGNTNVEVSGPAARLLARYPAALQDVAGVAALNQDDNNTTTAAAFTGYTDQADDQGFEQIAAFGGEIVAGSNPLVADGANGVLGAFVEPFPVHNPATGTFDTAINTVGWARWAGTSFAAPIISAAIANLLATGGALPTGAIGQMRALSQFDAAVGNLIEIRQGP